MKRLAFIVLIGVLLGSDSGAQSPAAGGGKVYTKNGDYTVKPSDLKNTLNFICPIPCTATMPASTANWPKTSSVKILNGGTTTVTVHATPASTFLGMVPANTTDVLLTAQGHWVDVTANTANNYVVFGQAGGSMGGSVGIAFMIDANNCFLVSPGICFLVQ